MEVLFRNKFCWKSRISSMKECYRTCSLMGFQNGKFTAWIWKLGILLPVYIGTRSGETLSLAARKGIKTDGMQMASFLPFKNWDFGTHLFWYPVWVLQIASSVVSACTVVSPDPLPPAICDCPMRCRENGKLFLFEWPLSLSHLGKVADCNQERPRQTKPKKGQFINFSWGQTGTKARCESRLFSQGKTPEFTKMGEIHDFSFWPFLWFRLPGRLRLQGVEHRH